MTLYRVRARMRFTEASGLATQARDEMAKRDPVTIRPGEPPEEPPVNKVVDHGDRQHYVADLALTDQASAEDAYAVLAASDLLGESERLPDDTGGPSRVPWVEWHTCDHDEDVRSGCVVAAVTVGG